MAIHRLNPIPENILENWKNREMIITKIRIDYQKHDENIGFVHNQTSPGYYCAFTGTLSKNFKSLQGAMKFMKKWGLSPVEVKMW